MDDFTLFESIERYLSDELNDAEIASFEQRIAEDASLRKLVLQHRAERMIIEQMAKEVLMSQMNKWHLENQTKQKRRRYLLIFIALGVVGALLAGWLLLDKKSEFNQVHDTPIASTKDSIKINQTDAKEEPALDKPTDQNLSQKRPDNNRYLAMVKSSFSLPYSGLKSTTNKSVMDSAILALLLTKPDTAISIFNALNANDQSKSVWKEIKALAYFQKEKYTEAFLLFDEVADLGVPPYANRSDWYAGLCLLARMPSTERALKRRLSGIANNPEHPFSEKAKGLLKGLTK